MTKRRIPSAFVPLVPAWLAQWAGHWPRFAQRYLQLDPRSLGVARLAISAWLLLDLHLWSSASVWMKLLATPVYVLLLVGFRTRVAQALTLVAIVSVRGGLSAWQTWPAATLPFIGLFTLFLPLQLRFSVDSLMARLRTPKEVRPEALAQRHLFAPAGVAVTSTAVTSLLLFTALICFATRSQIIWHNLGLAAAGLLLLNPWAWQRSRIVACLVAVVLSIAVRQPGILMLFLFFLPQNGWAWMAQAFGPSQARRRIVYIDAGCGVCFALSRLLARLDSFHLLTIVANDQPERPSDLSDELVQSTIVVDDPATQRRWLKAAAFAQIFAALPAGAPIAWLLRMPLVAWLATPAYDLFARNRTKVSVALGMAACGLPQTTAPANPATTSVEPPHAMQTLMANARESASVVVFVASLLLLAR